MRDSITRCLQDFSHEGTHGCRVLSLGNAALVEQKDRMPSTVAKFPDDNNLMEYLSWVMYEPFSALFCKPSSLDSNTLLIPFQTQSF